MRYLKKTEKKSELCLNRNRCAGNRLKKKKRFKSSTDLARSVLTVTHWPAAKPAPCPGQAFPAPFCPPTAPTPPHPEPAWPILTGIDDNLLQVNQKDTPQPRGIASSLKRESLTVAVQNFYDLNSMRCYCFGRFLFLQEASGTGDLTEAGTKQSYLQHITAYS